MLPAADRIAKKFLVSAYEDVRSTNPDLVSPAKHKPKFLSEEAQRSLKRRVRQLRSEWAELERETGDPIRARKARLDCHLNFIDIHEVLDGLLDDLAKLYLRRDLRLAEDTALSQGVRAAYDAARDGQREVLSRLGKGDVATGRKRLERIAREELMENIERIREKKRRYNRQKNNFMGQIQQLEAASDRMDAVSGQLTTEKLSRLASPAPAVAPPAPAVAPKGKRRRYTPPPGTWRERAEDYIFQGFWP